MRTSVFAAVGPVELIQLATGYGYVVVPPDAAPVSWALPQWSYGRMRCSADGARRRDMSGRAIRLTRARGGCRQLMPLLLFFLYCPSCTSQRRLSIGLLTCRLYWCAMEAMMGMDRSSVWSLNPTCCTKRRCARQAAECAGPRGGRCGSHCSGNEYESHPDCSGVTCRSWRNGRGWTVWSCHAVVLLDHGRARRLRCTARVSGRSCAGVGLSFHLQMRADQDRH